MFGLASVLAHALASVRTMLTAALTSSLLAGALGVLTPPAQAVETSLDDQVDAVLVISVDGLNPRAIRLLGPQRAPSLFRLKREGAYTLQARTELESTSTLPNHTGMMTGRRVNAAKGGHSITINEDDGSTVQDHAGEQVRSVFNRVHRLAGSTALFAGKDKFNLLARSWPKAIDRYTRIDSNPKLVDAAIADLNGTRRALTFVHLSLPDQVGHASGFMSPAYLDAVAQTDVQIGRLLNAVHADPWRRAHLAVIVTADHGGKGPSHYDPTRYADYRIPFFAWGAGIKPTGLYAINPDLANPGRGRPGYTGPQPVRNGMVANLVTDLLDIKPVPGSQLDRPRVLQVFAP